MKEITEASFNMAFSIDLVYNTNRKCLHGVKNSTFFFTKQFFAFHLNHDKILTELHQLIAMKFMYETNKLMACTEIIRLKQLNGQHITEIISLIISLYAIKVYGNMYLLLYIKVSKMFLFCFYRHLSESVESC